MHFGHLWIKDLCEHKCDSGCDAVWSDDEDQQKKKNKVDILSTNLQQEVLIIEQFKSFQFCAMAQTLIRFRFQLK